MKKYSPQYWAAIKADYESGARSVAQILEYYKVSEGAVYAHRKKGGWKKTESALPAIALTVPELEPAPPEGTPEASGRARLAPRLTRLLERTVAEIELAAAVPKDKDKDQTTMDRARDVRTLATVMRLLHELECPPAPATPMPQTGESEDNDDLIRQEIAERLGRLQEQSRTA